MFGLSTLAVAWWRKHACRCGSYLLVSNKSCPPFDGMAVMLEVKSEYIGWWKFLSTILHRFNNRPTCPRRQVPEREVRAWCAENGVPGSVYYCFHIMGGVDQLIRQYRSPRLQWHCLQWHPANSDTFGMSQMIGLVLHSLWLQWQSGYSDTFPTSRGCHCKRGKL